MRISTNQMQNQSVDAMLNLQAEQSKTQMQVTTGKRILAPADDPSGSAQALNLQQAITQTGQYQNNADAANVRLSLEDSNLSSVSTVLQRVRDLALQANSSTLNDNDRKSIATEMRQRLSELAGYANTKDSNGEYLFGGYQSSMEPYTVTAGGAYVYNGDNGQRYAQIGQSSQVATGDSGVAVFGSIPDGNGTFVTASGGTNTGTGAIDAGSVSGTFVPDRYTITMVQALPTDPITYNITNSGGTVVGSGAYTDGSPITFQGAKVTITGAQANGDTFTVNPSAKQNIFTVIDNLATALEQPATTDTERATLNSSIASGLNNIDRGSNLIDDVRAQIGGRLNMIDTQKNVNDGFKLQTQQALSAVQDLDYTEAVSRLNQQTLALQAAQQAFVKVQGLSLFNFLK